MYEIHFRVEFCINSALISVASAQIDTFPEAMCVNPEACLHLSFRTKSYMYAAKAPARRRANAVGMSYPFAAALDGLLEEPDVVVDPPPPP